MTSYGDLATAIAQAPTADDACAVLSPLSPNTRRTLADVLADEHEGALPAYNDQAQANRRAALRYIERTTTP